MVGDFTIEEAVAADAGADAGFVEEGVETSAPTETAAPSVGDFDSTHFASAVLGPFAVGYDGSGGMGAGSIHAQNASNSQQQTQAQKDRSAAATAQMTTAMQAQQAAYQAAYNNEVSLNIGGEDVEIKQGDLHKGFKAQRQQLEQQIRQTRQAGGTPSAADLRLLERLQEVEEATDPGDGHKMDEEQRELVQSFADDYPDEVEHVLGRENRQVELASEKFDSLYGNESSDSDVPASVEANDTNAIAISGTVGSSFDSAYGLESNNLRDAADVQTWTVSAAGTHTPSGVESPIALTGEFNNIVDGLEPQPDTLTSPESKAVSAPMDNDNSVVDQAGQTTVASANNIGFGSNVVW